MGKLLAPQNLLWLIGIAVMVGAVLIGSVYVLQRSFGRASEAAKTRPQRLQVEDEGAFTLSTIKSVVTDLKSEQKDLRLRLQAAENRFESTKRSFEILSREIDEGVIVFDAEGYISFSNPQARKILRVDTWSRRKYPEVFKEIAGLTDLVTSAIEPNTESAGEVLTVQMADGNPHSVHASILAARNNAGVLEAIICVFRNCNNSPTQS